MTTTSDTGSLLARSALEFIDEHGLDALTLRALGQAAGLHHTAVYRHHRSKDEVLQAVLALVIDEAIELAGELPDDPRTRIMVLATSLRDAMHAHPAVAAALLMPTPVIADSEASSRFQAAVVQALRGLGLSGRELLIHHQILESYVLGTIVFDFAGAPEHLESRRLRHRMIADESFEAVTRDTTGVDELNEEAFRRGLTVLLDSCVAAGARAT